MSAPLNLDPLRIAASQCPVVDGRDHPTEEREDPDILWCFECETGWVYIEETVTLEAWMLDLLPEMTELKIQIHKLEE